MAQNCPDCGGQKVIDWSSGYFECRTVVGVQTWHSWVPPIVGPPPYTTAGFLRQHATDVLCGHRWFVPSADHPKRMLCFHVDHAPATALCVRCGIGVCQQHSYGIPNDFSPMTADRMRLLYGSAAPRQVCTDCVDPLGNDLRNAERQADERSQSLYLTLPTLRSSDLPGLLDGTVRLAWSSADLIGANVRLGDIPRSILVPALAKAANWPAPRRIKVQFKDGSAKYTGWIIREIALPTAGVHIERHHRHLVGAAGHYIYHPDSTPWKGTGGAPYFDDRDWSGRLRWSRKEIHNDGGVLPSLMALLLDVSRQHR